MASSTLASALLRRAPARASIPHVSRALLVPHHTPLVRHSSRPAAAAPLKKGSGAKLFEYEAIKDLARTSPETVLIDVREPNEFDAGHIAGARNVPVGTQPEAMLLDADEFEDRFGFAKPALEDEVVFYCKAGVRSNAAAEIARQAGFERIGEYKGSWVDWLSKGGSVTR